MNSSTVEPLPVSRDLISDEDYVVINNVISYFMLFLSVTGVVTNAINIRAFVVMGLDDGISVSLLGLSVADFGHTACWTAAIIGQILHLMELKYGFRALTAQPVSARVITFLAGNTTNIFHQMTCLITTFLGVARCLCVVMPFRFKNVFTRSRSIIAQIIFLTVTLAMYSPVLFHMGTERKFDPSVNRTRVVLWISSKRAAIKNAAVLFHFIILSPVTSVVAFICVLIMARYLKQSLRFRNLSSSAKTGDNGNDAMEAGTKLSGKELQAVRQVMLICAIYTMCMVPAVLHAFYRSFNLEFEAGKGFHNFYMITTGIKAMFSLTNSASTFLVYYAYNSKFRSVWFVSGRVSKKNRGLDD